MSEHLRESVSALMDGEADDLELRRLLAAENTGKVSGSWSRYHLVRDTLQNPGQDAEFRHLDISQQISIAIAEETETTTAMPEQSENSNPWWKPAAGFAVAASVAMVVVFGVQTVDQSSPTLNSNSIAVGSQPVTSSRVYPVQAASMQASSNGAVSLSSSELPGDAAASKAAADLEAQKRLDKYILRHTERAALNNGQGVISFARVASFEEQ